MRLILVLTIFFLSGQLGYCQSRSYRLRCYIPAVIGYNKGADEVASNNKDLIVKERITERAGTPCKIITITSR